MNYFDKFVQIMQLLGAILFVCFAVFNLIRSIIFFDFDLFPIFMFGILSLLSFSMLGMSVNELKKEE